MGYSPWGHEELDTTKATEYARMHGVCFFFFKDSSSGNKLMIVELRFGIAWEQDVGTCQSTFQHLLQSNNISS